MQLDGAKSRRVGDRNVTRNLWKVSAVFCALLAFVGIPGVQAYAQQNLQGEDLPPMRFAVVRSSEEGCEPVCTEWISAEGAITSDTPAKLQSILKRLNGRRLPVIVHSPGGDVNAALKLGRLIRKAKLNVAVGQTFFFGCKPEIADCTENSGKAARFIGKPYFFSAFCNSACPLVLAGGVKRMVGYEAFLGVHQVTTTWTQQKIMYRTTYRLVNGRKKILSKKVVSRKNAGSYKTYEMSKALEKQLAAYLNEMGVDRRVLDLAIRTPASTIQNMSLVEMFEAKLVTSYGNATAVTAKSNCTYVPAAENCRLFTEADLEPAK